MLPKSFKPENRLKFRFILFQEVFFFFNSVQASSKCVMRIKRKKPLLYIGCRFRKRKAFDLV